MVEKIFDEKSDQFLAVALKGIDALKSYPEASVSGVAENIDLVLRILRERLCDREAIAANERKISGWQSTANIPGHSGHILVTDGEYVDIGNAHGASFGGFVRFVKAWMPLPSVGGVAAALSEGTSHD
jgi:hypothetical protein